MRTTYYILNDEEGHYISFPYNKLSEAREQKKQILLYRNKPIRILKVKIDIKEAIEV